MKLVTSRSIRHGWLALLAVLACQARADELEVISLQFRLAEDLFPVLQPLVEPGGVITGTGDTLFVRASAANLVQLRDAIATLDRAPRRLVITVGQSSGAAAARADARGAVTVRAGDVPDAPEQNEPSVNGAVVVGAGTSRDDITNVSSVQALEGYEALVMIGQSRPFDSASVTPGWHGPEVARTTEYRDVGTGFYVTPRLTGDRVVLEISPQQQRVDTDRGREVVATRQAVTTVSGRLGEWIAVGGVQQSGAGSDRGLLTWGSRSGADYYTAWVKVDAAP